MNFDNLPPEQKEQAKKDFIDIAGKANSIVALLKQQDYPPNHVFLVGACIMVMVEKIIGETEDKHILPPATKVIAELRKSMTAMKG